MTATTNQVSKRGNILAKAERTLKIQRLIIEQAECCLKALRPEGVLGEYCTQLLLPADLTRGEREWAVKKVVTRLQNLGFQTRDIGRETIAVSWPDIR